MRPSYPHNRPGMHHVVFTHGARTVNILELVTDISLRSLRTLAREHAPSARRVTAWTYQAGTYMCTDRKVADLTL